MRLILLLILLILSFGFLGFKIGNNKTELQDISYFETDVGNLSAEFYACDFGILTNINRDNILDEELLTISCNPERKE